MEGSTKVTDMLQACVCVYDIKVKSDNAHCLHMSCYYSDVTQGRWRLLNNLVTSWINANHFPTDYANSGSFQADANVIHSLCVCVPSKTQHLTHILYSNIGSTKDKESASGGSVIYQS